MTVLTGAELIEQGIIYDGVSYKVDDKATPSYGTDGALYTFRGDVDLERHGTITLHPGGLFHTMSRELVVMPEDCIGLLWPKSTYTRQGLMFVSCAPVDPGYRGRLGIMYHNCSANYILIHPKGGLMQMTVHRLSDITTAYNGRWQNG